MADPLVDTNQTSHAESVERFKSVFEAANDAMVLSDADGIVSDANEAYFELYGFSSEEVIGKKFYIIFPEESHPEVMEIYRQAFNGDHKAVNYESVITRKDGTTRTVEITLEELPR